MKLQSRNTAMEAAVVEYIIGEIIEISGNVTLNKNLKTIKYSDVEQALEEDI